ncbi:MAG: triose-phosphate isomerase [Candidatus Marinimicrobia bacterium]|jgi:triosephosphate isomerase (TIM)|nr:triose-phosphate isomerase [Candidatus Neomarinimicrobiota bacterium]
MASKYCVANWKMNFNGQQGKEFVSLLNSKDLNNGQSQIILCPSFTSLFSMVEASSNSAISVGAQNMHFEDSGPYTGEVSAQMLNETDVKFVILGHSERRHVFGETDDMIHAKMVQSIKSGLTPILCIGENLDERESGNTNQVLRSQLEAGLADVNGEYIIAYEPVWAIGTGKSATSEMVAETHASIRNILAELNVSENVSLLYGGSVSPQNTAELAAVENVDGFLIGGASLDVEKFYSIYSDL